MWRLRTGRRAWCTAAIVLLAAGCAARVRPVPSPSPPSLLTQTGIASWYGPGFHGARTANGEVYNQYALTAAHPSLPFGSRVLVTNLRNGRKVQVRINDRGPFVHGRVIDLSYAAARTLGLIKPGTGPVRVDLLPGGTVSSRVTYTVQAGAFQDPRNAARLRDALATHFPAAYISPARRRATTHYRVRVGHFEKRAEAERLATRVTACRFRAIVVEEPAALVPARIAAVSP